MAPTAFDTARDTLLTDPNLGEDASFVPFGAAAIGVRVCLAPVDPSHLALGLVGASAPGWRAHLSRTQLPTRPVVEADTLSMRGQTWRLREVTESADGMWTCDVYPIG